MIPATGVPALWAVVTHGDSVPPLVGLVIGWRESARGGHDETLYEPVVVWDNDDLAIHSFDGLAEYITSGAVKLFASRVDATAYARHTASAKTGGEAS